MEGASMASELLDNLIDSLGEDKSPERADSQDRTESGGEPTEESPEETPDTGSQESAEESDRDSAEDEDVISLPTARMLGIEKLNLKDRSQVETYLRSLDALYRRTQSEADKLRGRGGEAQPKKDERDQAQEAIAPIDEKQLREVWRAEADELGIDPATYAKRRETEAAFAIQQGAILAFQEAQRRGLLLSEQDRAIINSAKKLHIENEIATDVQAIYSIFPDEAKDVPRQIVRDVMVELVQDITTAQEDDPEAFKAICAQLQTPAGINLAYRKVLSEAKSRAAKGPNGNTRTAPNGVASDSVRPAPGKTAPKGRPPRAERHLAEDEVEDLSSIMHDVLTGGGSRRR
jgi:hypothetical protein